MRELISRALAEADGSKPDAAARLGISLATLYEKLKDQGKRWLASAAARPDRFPDFRNPSPKVWKLFLHVLAHAGRPGF
jgi:hypothetical protein